VRTASGVKLPTASEAPEDTLGDAFATVLVAGFTVDADSSGSGGV